MFQAQSPSASQVASQLLTPSSSLNKSITNFNDVEDEVDYDTLKDDQQIIDKTLKFLRNYKGSKHKVGSKSRPNSSLSPGSKIPDSVSNDLKSLSDINDLHPGVLLDLLKKINNLNKRILHNYEILNSKYNKLEAEFSNKLSPNITNSTSLSQHTVDHPQSTPSDNPPIITNDIHEHDNTIKLRIDALEQNVNNNIILCNGSFIDGIGEDVLTDKIKEKITDLVPEIIPRDIVNASYLGANKKLAKIVCVSANVKNTILRTIKKKKPNDIYFNEFLTRHRHNLFYQLRQLRKENREIKSVYTRNGSVYYKLQLNDQYHKVSSVDDITQLKIKISNHINNDDNNES